MMTEIGQNSNHSYANTNEEDSTSVPSLTEVHVLYEPKRIHEYISKSSFPLMVVDGSICIQRTTKCDDSGDIVYEVTDIETKHKETVYVECFPEYILNRQLVKLSKKEEIPVRKGGMLNCKLDDITEI